MKKFQLLIKRVFDILFSFLAIVLLTAIPVMLVIPIVIRLTSKGPALFRQERVGRNGKIFKIYKFRTMLLMEDRKNPDGTIREPNDSITGVGRFLRKTSLDELPQLFNILGGTMSFVGPRPMIPSQARKISEEDNCRHSMRPGVTGWAQVNGRNNLTWPEKLKFDREYIEHFSLGLDIRIFFLTIRSVVRREGIDYVHVMGDKP